MPSHPPRQRRWPTCLLMARSTWAVCLLVSGTLAGCGATSAGSAGAGSSTKTPSLSSPSVAASRSTAFTKSSATSLAAEQVVSRIAAEAKSAKLTVVYTAKTDPNGDLGRPGKYISKAVFTDSRVDERKVSDSSKGSVELGGGVEASRLPMPPVNVRNTFRASLRVHRCWAQSTTTLPGVYCSG
jgi:hypothetical protein